MSNRGEREVEYLRHSRQKGFTLIELMIVVAIIGVLAVLAIYGVSKYLRTAKTAEATNALGAMNRGAVAAYQREIAPTQLLAGGTTSATWVHQLCDSANPVPGTVPAATKYQPNPTAGADYDTTNQSKGWICIRFEMRDPQYYQYAYTKGGNAQIATDAAATMGGLGANSWLVEAKGDLDGNGAFSNFATGGDTTTKNAVTFTQLAITNETE